MSKVAELRVGSRIDNSQAKKDAKELEKIVDNTASNINDTDASVDLDIKQAEKEIKQLEKEIERYQRKIDELAAGKLSSYDAERRAIESSTKADLAKATTPNQKANIQQMGNVSLEQLDKKYSSVLAKADQYGSILAKNDIKLQQLKRHVQQQSQQQTQTNQKTIQYDSILTKNIAKLQQSKLQLQQQKQQQTLINQKALQTVNNTGRLQKAIQTSKILIMQMATGLKKASSTVKGALLKSLTKANSRLKTMRTNANHLHKRLLRVGAGLMGMHSLMSGFTSIMHYALNDNEELYNKLKAIRGVIGQAFIPAIQILLNGLSQIVTFADKLYQLFTGTSFIAKYNASQAKKMAESTADAAESAKEYQRQLAGFDEINKLSDNSSSSSGSGNSEEVSGFFQETALNGFVKKIIDKIKSGDWAGVGTVIANGINSSVSKLNWNNIQNKVNTFCTNMGNAVNGFVSALDWDSIGNSVGVGINTITDAVNTLTDKIDWVKIGSKFSTSLNSTISSLSDSGIGKTLTSGLKVLNESLYGFLSGEDGDGGFDFEALGEKFGANVTAAFENIDWKHVGSNISSSIGGAADLLSGFLSDFDMSTIYQTVIDMISGIDISKLASSLFKLIGSVVGWILSNPSNLVEIWADAIESIVDYFTPYIEECGGDIMAGIGEGISDWFSNIDDWIKENIFEPFIEGFKDTFDIHSPSQHEDIKDLGKNIILGVFSGISEKMDNVRTWLEDNVFSKFTNAWSKMGELKVTFNAKLTEAFNNAKSKWDSIKNKTRTTTISGKVSEKFSKLKTKWDSIKTKTRTTTISGKISSKFTKAKKDWDSIKSKTTTVTTKLKDSITSGIKNILQSLVSMINKIIGALNKLPIGIDIPKISMPKLAKGGIVNNPGRGVDITAGEAGPEAVLPLTDSVLGKIAAMIGDKIGGNGQIVIPIYLDGKKITSYVIDLQNQRAFALNKGGAY